MFVRPSFCACGYMVKMGAWPARSGVDNGRPNGSARCAWYGASDVLIIKGVRKESMMLHRPVASKKRVVAFAGVNPRFFVSCDGYLTGHSLQTSALRQVRSGLRRRACSSSGDALSQRTGQNSSAAFTLANLAGLRRHSRIPCRLSFAVMFRLGGPCGRRDRGAGLQRRKRLGSSKVRSAQLSWSYRSQAISDESDVADAD